MDRLKAKFIELFVDPLLNGPPPLEPKIVEFFNTKDEADTRVGDAGAVASMVETVASKLKSYKTHREAFKNIVLQTDQPRNIGPDAKPFDAGAEGDALFNELVTCCYAAPTVYDCSKVDPAGFYAIYNRQDPVACIEGLINKITGRYPVASDAKCDEYAGLLAAQNNDALQRGGRRTRRRGRKGKSRKGSRRH
jgi:hypothetical protein